MSQPFAFTLRDRLYATWDKAQSALIEQLDQLYAQLSQLPDTPATSTAGVWVNLPLSSVVLAIPGAGNQWVNVATAPGTTFYQVSYTLVGNTMWLNISLPVTALTVAVPTSVATIGIPPGYRVAGVSSAGTFIGRSHFGHCVILNSGTQVPGVLFASAGATAVTVSPVNGAPFVTDASFTVEGQIMLEVTAA